MKYAFSNLINSLFVKGGWKKILNVSRGKNSSSSHWTLQLNVKSYLKHLYIPNLESY